MHFRRRHPKADRLCSGLLFCWHHRHPFKAPADRPNLTKRSPQEGMAISQQNRPSRALNSRHPLSSRPSSSESTCPISEPGVVPGG